MINNVLGFFRNEDNHSKIAPILSIILGLVFGGILMMFSGTDPFTGYAAVLKGSIGNVERIGNMLLQASTLILAGLAVAFAFRTALFNIGVPGQMLIGGFAAVYVGVVLELPRPLHVTLAVIVAIIAGALWAFIPAILKAYYKINEVVSTIMMNYIAIWLVQYLVKNNIKGNFDTESKVIHKTASLRADWLTDLFNGSYVNYGLFIAIAVAILFWFIFKKTTFGYEIKAVGYNVNASKYAGIKVNRNIVLSLMISGAIAGIAGASFYIGYMDHIKIGMLPQLGYDGIAVALLGLNSAIGVVLSALLFGILNTGGLFMNAAVDVPNEVVSIIIASIIYFAATSLIFRDFLKKVTKPKNKKGGAK